MTEMADASRVRIADASDVEELFSLCCKMHDENFILPMSEQKVRELLLNCTQPQVEKRPGVIGIVGAKGQIEGAIGLVFESTWYSDELCIFDAWNFVLPQYRSSTNSKDLIAWAKKISDHFGYPLMIGILSNHRTEAKVRLFRKQLGNPVGAFFMYGNTYQLGVH